MSCTLVMVAGQAPLLETTLTNGFSGAPLNSASLEATIVDENDVPVAGETWPATLAYVSASAGVYRKQLANGVALVPGTRYVIQYEANDASLAQPYFWSEELVVAVDACEAALPTSSPYSPAYRAPSASDLLADAEAKYHALLTGTSARVIVDQSGERVEFTAANRASLAAYIQQMRRDLGVASNAGPARVFF